MTVAIGLNPIIWTSDDMRERGGDIPLETCLAQTRQAGYSGTELGGTFPRTATALGPRLAAHDLRLVSGRHDGRMAERDADAEFTALMPHLTLLRDLGCKVAVYADTSGRREGAPFQPMSRRPRLADADWSDYGTRLTELAERMAAFGVGMAFHHHMGTIIETDDEIDKLMAHTGPAVGLLYDTGHCLFSGGDPATLLDRHLDRIVHVHCKDARRETLERARATDLSVMDAVRHGVFTVPGDGCIDFAPLLRRLATHGYAGWLVVAAEQDPRRADPLTSATMGCRNMTTLARDAGFSIAP